MTIDSDSDSGPGRQNPVSSMPPPHVERGQTVRHEALANDVAHGATQQTAVPEGTSEINVDDLEADEASDNWAVSTQSGPQSTGDPFADFEGDIDGDDTQIEMEDELPEQHTHLIRDVVEPVALVAVEGKDKGRRFTLIKGENSIGRSLDNDVILADPAVSRKHTKIIVEEDEVILVDLGSGNGTMVNGLKVHRTQLAHGDRVELGATVLSLDLPENHPARRRRSLSKIIKEQNPANEVPVAVGLEPHQEQTLFSSTATPTDHMANTSVTSTELVWQQHLRPTIAMMRGSAMGQNVLIPKTWLIALILVGVMLALLLGATVTVLVLKNSGKRADSYDAVTLAQFVKQGRDAYQHKQWDMAEQLFSRVLAHRPGDQSAMQYLRLIGDAREHETLLRNAREALNLGDIRGALSQTASIPATSPLAPEAESVRFSARAKEVAEHVAASEAAKRRGDLREAQRRMNMALMLDPNHELIQEDASPVKADPHRSATYGKQGVASTANTPASSVKNRILALYQAGDFTKASGVARTYVASHGGEPEAQELARLSGQIDRFSVYYGKIRNEKNTASIVKQLQSAYLLDMQVSGGFYARELRTPLLNEYVDQAKKAWQRAQYSFACQSVLQGWRLDPVNAEVQQLMQNCEQKAEQLLKDAKRIEKTEPTRAMTLYKDVVSMVPPGTGLYRQASERLDSKGSSARDEDESN